MNLPRQLKIRKQELGSTLADLSALTGMPAPQISNTLNGRVDPRASSVEALADSLNARWVLVPKHVLPEVERLLSGKPLGPDNVPSTMDRLFGDSAKPDE